MNNVLRFTVCKVLNHKYVKVQIPQGRDEEAPGMFLRSLRCGKDNHSAGTNARGGGGMI